MQQFPRFLLRFAFFFRVRYALKVEANRREEFLNASKFSIQTENIPIEMQNKCRILLSILWIGKNVELF